MEARGLAGRIARRLGCREGVEVSFVGERFAADEKLRRRYRIEGWPALLVFHRDELLFRYVRLPDERSVLADIGRITADVSPG